jgi:hypothetical protein
VFNVYQVPSGSALTTEPLGTKFKFWYRDPNFGLTLFKEGRPGTGENWAERIACELAAMIDLPHAKYELAQYEDRFGVVSRSLVDRTARIIHGNELLAAQTTGYVKSENTRYRNPNHTLRRVLAYLRRSSSVLGAPYGWPQSAGLRSALDFFIGYLMFDTWIANQDRHDENWALLRTSEGNLFLSPSFDHGSSMARNEPDASRLERLITRDQPRHISTFVRSARSAFYPQAYEPGQRPLYTIDAFVQAAAQSPQAAAEWRDRLAKVDDTRIRTIIDQIPGDWMTTPARMFTAELLRLNRERILNTEFT